MNNCPNCGESWIGDPIPEEHQHLFGYETHFSRVIGIEDPKVYDGVLYWQCPDCGSTFNRDWSKR